MFRSHAGFTAVAVLSLALGIGANTAIFTVVDAVLLKMLPVKEPQELWVFGESQSRGFFGSDDPLQVSTTLYSYPNYKDLRHDNAVFDRLAAVGSTDATVYVRDPNAPSGTLPEAAQARLVSGNYFEVLGVEPMLGRVIHPGDDVTAGAHPVAVLSHGYWQRRFASDPQIVGRGLLINGQSFTVIGIGPRGFRGETLGWNPDIFTPLAMQNEITRFGSFLEQRNLAFLLLLGRMKEGVTLEQASAAMSLRFQQLVRAEAGDLGPDREAKLREIRIGITPAHEALSSLRRDFREPLFLLMAVVGLVLLIACANVANLLLARASTRRKEIGVRLALGAGRGRLVRQLMTESMLLAVSGGALGLLLAPWATQLLVGMVYTTGQTVPLDVDPDARLLAFTCGVSLLTGVLFGLMPALRSTRLDLAPTLKVNARGSIGERSRLGLTKGLVAVQVALSLVLLVGASLFAGSLRNLRGLDLGFRPEHVLTVQIDQRGAGYQNEQLPALDRRILEDVRAIPGVESASLSFITLLTGVRRAERAEIEGYEFQPEESRSVQIIHVSPGYFETVGMTLLEGRALDERDREGGTPSIVINERLRERFFAGRQALGAHIRFGGEDAPNREIVGVVRDAKYNEMREETPFVAFLPIYQQPQHANSLDIRVRG
jgi:predicted permease